MQARTLPLVVLVSLLTLTVPSQAGARPPNRGTAELRLGGGSPGLLGDATPNGVFHLDDSYTIFGLDLALGSFVADHVELGFDLSILHVDEGGTLFGFGPFLKLLSGGRAVRLYAELGPGLAIVTNGSTNTAFRFRVSLGLEAFVTDAWSIRIGPVYQLFIDEDRALHGFGGAWGISAYF